MGVSVLAILLGLTMPALRGISANSQESELKRRLLLVRQASGRASADIGCFIGQLSDLTLSASPGTCFNENGDPVSIPVGSWRGPYLASLPIDPVSRAPFTYQTGSGMGRVASSASGNDSKGVPFAGY